MKKIMSFALIGVLAVNLTACGGTSSACKKVYDREIEFMISDAEAMKVILESDGEKSMMGGTSFFMPSDAEEKTMKSCTYDDEMTANMTKAKEIKDDYKELEKLLSDVQTNFDKDKKKKAVDKFLDKVEKLKEKYSADGALEIGLIWPNGSRLLMLHLLCNIDCYDISEK